MQQNLFVVMRVGSTVVLSYLVADFEPWCGDKDFLLPCCLRLLAACCLLLVACCLLKCVAHPWTLRRGVKPRQGKPSSAIKSLIRLACIKTQTRTEVGPALS